MIYKMIHTFSVRVLRKTFTRSYKYTNYKCQNYQFIHNWTNLQIGGSNDLFKALKYLKRIFLLEAINGLVIKTALFILINILNPTRMRKYKNGKTFLDIVITFSLYSKYITWNSVSQEYEIFLLLLVIICLSCNWWLSYRKEENLY